MGAQQLPTDGHRLNVADAERSKARIADIELGLANPEDAIFWRDKAMRRILALEEDAEDFGLCVHEQAELVILRQMVERHDLQVAGLERGRA
jgi:hypothetical protein